MAELYGADNAAWLKPEPGRSDGVRFVVRRALLFSAGVGAWFGSEATQTAPMPAAVTSWPLGRALGILGVAGVLGRDTELALKGVVRPLALAARFGR
ncbi:hypothetical protein [Streptomyces sp. YGL11-2]|uniref:hypothetical protein n=1 Tax=Streptomyces sp. YGL11-2 TaxID=3414028 RepID=UPI003CF7EFC6